jgi:polyisoprenoid-binding protein YceI
MVSAVTTTQWKLDPSQSEVTFTVRHMMVAKVRGAFRELSGTLELQGEELASGNTQVEVDVGSVDTGDRSRDDFLRSEEFFAASKHPKLRFRSQAVDKRGRRLLVRGELQMRGVGRPVELTVELLGAAGGQRLAFKGETVLHRKDWGLTWSQALEAGGFLVGDEVRVALRVEFVRS